MSDGSSDAPNLPSWPLYMMVPGQAVGADSLCKYPSGGATSPTCTASPGATAATGSMAASLNGFSSHPASIVPLGGAGSFYFSFCATDGLMIGDTADTNLSSSYANAVTSPTFSSSNTTTNSQAVSLATPSGGVMNAMHLAPVNLEYFYGLPTPGAPSRVDCADSCTASNCSSTSDHQVGEYGAIPPAMPANSLVLTSNPPSPGGVQKDVLALMAAEQQQQKFVLQQRNVYMSGLPVNFRPSAFRAMCGVFGRIESSKLCMEADDSSRCRGFGFVLFYDVESATSCISSLNGKVMQGRTLQVRRADLSAAPQPLHPVTQRNRTGSGLATPPSQGQQAASTATLPGPPAPSGLPIYSPQPSPVGQPNTNPVVVSAVPFTYAPSMGAAPPLGSTSLRSVSTANSFSLGANTPVSSSLVATSAPTVMYASNTGMHPTIRGGVPMMQLFTAMPPCNAPSMVQQQPSTMSHTSLSSRDGATSHNETPSSLTSSCAPTGFSSSSSQHLIQLQTPATQQHSIPVKQQAPASQKTQSQRAMSTGANMAIYHTLETTSGSQDYLIGVDPKMPPSNLFYFISS